MSKYIVTTVLGLCLAVPGYAQSEKKQPGAPGQADAQDQQAQQPGRPGQATRPGQPGRPGQATPSGRQGSRTPPRVFVALRGVFGDDPDRDKGLAPSAILQGLMKLDDNPKDGKLSPNELMQPSKP